MRGPGTAVPVESIPGQATPARWALRVAELRARAFHREVLAHGPLPLEVLARRIGDRSKA